METDDERERTLYARALRELTVAVGGLVTFMTPFEGAQTAMEARIIGYRQLLKMLLHARALLTLAPPPDVEGLGDLHSTALLARAVIDAFANFYYFCVDEVDEDERDPREAVWRYHETKRRLSGVLRVNPDSAGVADLEHDVTTLLERIVGNPSYLALDGRAQTNLRRGGDARTLGHGVIMARAGIHDSFYRSHYNTLSDYAHGYGMADSQMGALVDDVEPAVWMMKIRIECATAWLCKALVTAAGAFEDRGFRPSEELYMVCDKWNALMQWDPRTPPVDIPTLVWPRP